MRKHYVDNKEAYVAKAKRNNERYKNRIRSEIVTYLTSHPCIDCGEVDPVVLEFDHKDPHTKEFNIAEAFTRCTTSKALVAEIEKCDVRCANCHRRKTARQFNWWDRAGVYPLATNQLEG